MPNNRQWAVLFWLAVLAIWALSKGDIRSSLLNVLRSLVQPKISIPLGLMVLWVCLEVWVGARRDIWRWALTTDTAFWLVTSGLVLFFNFNEASERPDFFQRKSFAAFGPAVFMEGFLDEFVFPLVVEIVLQFVLAFLAMMAAVASTMSAEQRRIGSVASFLVGLIVLVIIAIAVVEAISGWDEIDKGNLVRQAVLPGWLTIGLLPVIYIIALLAAYEVVFRRLDWNSGPKRKVPLRNKLALMTGLHVRAHEVGSFTGPWLHRLATAPSSRDAREVVRDFRRRRREKGHAEKEARERLNRFAGVDRVDEQGRRLDRREFKETSDALRWLATRMMGWYRHDNRYQAGLLERLGDDFTREGLPKPSGITMHVSDDGKAWYAWRQTVTGWCFAIGAAAPPPDQWEYDGPEPPSGFPGEDPAWGPHAFSNTANHNW